LFVALEGGKERGEGDEDSEMSATTNKQQVGGVDPNKVMLVFKGRCDR
jgi:hypothetical protein